MENARGNGKCRRESTNKSQEQVEFSYSYPLPPNYKYLFFLVILLFSILIILILYKAPEPPKPRKWSAIFILGDSTVHCRSNSLVGSLFFPCNGSKPIAIPEIIAKKMGFNRTEQFGVKDVVPIINFGSSIATIGGNPDPLYLQVERALDSIRLLELGMSQADLKDFMKSTLFYLSIGKNDYLRLSSMDYSNERFAQDLVTVMVKAIKELYFSGAKKIVCMGIAPLGCSPRPLLRLGLRSYELRAQLGHCVDNQLNDLIIEYNNMLSQKLSMLKMELGDLDIVYCDVYNGMMNILHHWYRYVYTSMWWDSHDPSEMMNMLLADSIWSNQASLGQLCRPLSIHQLASI